MEINYILLAHKNPDQLQRLIERLTARYVKFYIHIDKQVDINKFKRKIPESDEIFYLRNIDRENGTWGDLGIVKATINAMKLILNQKRNGVCILLSGQDYPLVSTAKISDFLNEHQKINFISTVSLPFKGWHKGGKDRIEKYKFNKSFKRGHFIQMPSIWEKEFYQKDTPGRINFLRKKGKFKEILKLFKKRRFPKDIKPYGGSQWFILPISTIESILLYLQQNPKYLSYHQFTLLPDEILIQSIVRKLEEEGKIRPSLTYVNWTRPHGDLPVTFKTEDFEELKSKSKNFLFARKFDTSQDHNILDLIDEHLLR